MLTTTVNIRKQRHGNMALFSDIYGKITSLDLILCIEIIGLLLSDIQKKLILSIDLKEFLDVRFENWLNYYKSYFE
jgi:hypothetical protein